MNTDDSGGTFHGIPINNPTYVPSPVSQAAIYLQSHSRQSIAIPEPQLQLNRNSFTIEVWIHPITLSPYDNSIFAQCQKATLDKCLHISVRNRTLFMNYYKDPVKGNTRLNDRIWYHAAFVYDSRKNDISIYLNGQLDARKSLQHVNSGTSDIITIGTSKISVVHNTHFDGYLDQLSISSSAKSADEILKASKNIQSEQSQGNYSGEYVDFN